MKIEILSRSPEDLEEMDYSDGLEIKIDGKKVFSVYDGEPEDSNLMRSFNDCLKIGELLRIAYDAGKKGEKFEITKGNLED